MEQLLASMGCIVPTARQEQHQQFGRAIAIPLLD
jgi:hypothetical protein